MKSNSQSSSIKGHKNKHRHKIVDGIKHLTASLLAKKKEEAEKGGETEEEEDNLARFITNFDA